MAEFIVFALNQGGSILAEVDYGQPTAGLVDASRVLDVAKRASLTLEDALDQIKPAVRSIAASLHSTLVELSPSEFQIEFGIKLHGEAGAIITSAGAEANYSIRMTWESPS